MRHMKTQTGIETQKHRQGLKRITTRTKNCNTIGHTQELRHPKTQELKHKRTQIRVETQKDTQELRHNKTQTGVERH